MEASLSVAVRPKARSTCDGSGTPDEQAAPVDAASRGCNPPRISCALKPSNLTLALPGWRRLPTEPLTVTGACPCCRCLMNESRCRVTRVRSSKTSRPTGPTGSARLRTPNRRGELPASHPRSYHPLADSGDRSCFERGGLGCGRSQLRVTVPYQPDRVGQRPPLRRVPAQPQSRAKRKA